VRESAGFWADKTME